MNLATHYGCANTYYLLPQSLDKYRNLQRRRTCFLRRSTATSLLPFPPFLSPSGPNWHMLGICLNHKIARVSFRLRSQRRRRLRLSPLLLSSPLLSSFSHILFRPFHMECYAPSSSSVVVCSLFSHSTSTHYPSLSFAIPFKFWLPISHSLVSFESLCRCT